MKKSVLYFLFLVAIFLAPSIVSAQAEVKNSTSRVITLQSLNKDGEVTINPYKKGVVDFAGINGILKCSLFYYIGQSEVSVGVIEKTLDNGKCEITSGDLTGVTDKSKKEEVIKKSEEGTKTRKNVPQKSAPVEEPNVNNNRPTTTIKVVNESSYSFVILNGIFAGLALAPGMESDNSYDINTGQIEFTVKHQTETDSTSSGRAYRESVYSSIVTQGQEKIVIKNENLTANIGGSIDTYARSLIPYKIFFSAGPWKGKALAYKDRTTKATLSEGFNSLAIQFVGKDGFKYQADLEFIVTPAEKQIEFRETDIRNKIKVN